MSDLRSDLEAPTLLSVEVGTSQNQIPTLPPQQPQLQHQTLRNYEGILPPPSIPVQILLPPVIATLNVRQRTNPENQGQGSSTAQLQHQILQNYRRTLPKPGQNPGPVHTAGDNLNYNNLQTLNSTKPAPIQIPLSAADSTKPAPIQIPLSAAGDPNTRRYRDSLNDKFRELELEIQPSIFHYIEGPRLNRPDILKMATDTIRDLKAQMDKLKTERAQKEVAENNQRKVLYDKMMLLEDKNEKLETEIKQLKDRCKSLEKVKKERKRRGKKEKRSGAATRDFHMTLRSTINH